MGIESPGDFEIDTDVVLHHDIPESWDAFVYVLEGEVTFGAPNSSTVGSHHTLLLSSGNVWNNNVNNKPCRFVVIGG